MGRTNEPVTWSAVELNGGTRVTRSYVRRVAVALSQRDTMLVFSVAGCNALNVGYTPRALHTWPVRTSRISAVLDELEGDEAALYAFGAPPPPYSTRKSVCILDHYPFESTSVQAPTSGASLGT